MAAPRNPYAIYGENKVLTASKEELTLMLYDGMVKFAKIAYEAMQNKEIEKAHRNIIKVENIILELQMTLDRKYPISKDFDEMYQLIYDKLVHANMRQDLKVLNECIGLLEDFRDLWKNSMKAAKEQRAENFKPGPISAQV